MHDTALKIGKAAIEIYAAGTSPILEVGSLDVNGSLRQFAPDGSSYVGVDLEPGKNVDIVVNSGKPFPFKNEAFELILASSVLEHDPAFWQTFLELARLLRRGGHLYINAPSNGAVHRYPEDHWRFYPDSGRALERWSCSQGHQMQLIESFTAPREGDIWNDFVAVFRKGDEKGELQGRFLYSEFNGENVWVRGAPEMIKTNAETQDMQIVRETLQMVEEIENRDSDLRAQALAANQKILSLEQSLQQINDQLEETQKARDALAHDADRRNAEAAEEIRNLKTVAADLKSANKKLIRELREKNAAVDFERRQAKNAITENFQTKNRLNSTQKRLEHVEASVKIRFDELASITQYLSHSEKERRAVVLQRQWMTEVHNLLAAMPAWWSLLPKALRRRLRLGRLYRAGLFNFTGYLKLYPDVAESGIDPLLHYILHGVHEGRVLPR